MYPPLGPIAEPARHDSPAVPDRSEKKQAAEAQESHRAADTKERLYAVLRWIACAPAAIAASTAIYIVVLFGNRLGMELNYMNPDSVLGRIFVYALAFMIPGGVAVTVATQVAPAHKKIVALASSGTILFLSGLLFYPVLFSQNWWWAYCLVCANIGSIGTAHSIARGGESAE
jgi:hypothetical protein